MTKLPEPAFTTDLINALCAALTPEDHARDILREALPGVPDRFDDELYDVFRRKRNYPGQDMDIF